LSVPLQHFSKLERSEPAWVRYLFAVAACVLAVLLDQLLTRLTDDPVYPFLSAFAAILGTASWAGPGPGMLATILLVAWSAVDLSLRGGSLPNTVVRGLLLLVTGSILSIVTARLWRSMKQASLSEAWHRQLLETAAEGIWVHDENGVITYANVRMSELLGVGVDDLIGRRVEEFFLPADLSMERIRAVNLRNGSKEQFDRRLRRSDGTEIWVLTCCNLVGSDTSAGGRPGSLAMMTDITERKRAEFALRRSEERFRNLFESVLEGVYQSSPDGRILAANPMLLQMLGLANEAQLNDVNIAHDLYVDPGTRQRLLEQLEREGSIQNVEYELRRRDGQIITVLENARVVRDETGAVLYYEGTLTDITPRKAMEEQLRQAQKVEALGRLAGSVANDFNNVLTIITGFAQLALSDLPPLHPARPSTEQVLDAAERALALTRQLLLFSRRQAPAEGSLDLNRTIERLEITRQAGVVVSLAHEPVMVYAMPKHIEPVVSAFADLYRKRQSQAASLGIRTALTNLDAEYCRRAPHAVPGPYAVLSIGEPAQAPIQDVVSGDNFTLMRAGESNALGVSAAHARIAQCGGFIVVGSHPAGAGDPGISSFHIFLPCAKGRVGPAPFQVPSSAPAGETILLVEGEPLIRELSRDMLERQGYRVILASSASEAEQIGRSAGSFDLLITDAAMPNSSGAELARKLRAAHPGLKVLYISGYAEEPRPLSDPAIEGAAFLQKPFSADSLGRKIRQMLSRS
jgi:PAS domain S-box-containing protein